MTSRMKDQRPVQHSSRIYFQYLASLCLITEGSYQLCKSTKIPQCSYEDTDIKEHVVATYDRSQTSTTILVGYRHIVQTMSNLSYWTNMKAKSNTAAVTGRSTGKILLTM